MMKADQRAYERYMRRLGTTGRKLVIVPYR